MDKTEYEAAFEEGLNAAPVRYLEENGKVPFLTLPAGAQIATLEKFLVKPLVKRLQVELTDQSDFIRYVNENRGSTTQMFWTKAIIMAVFDFHEPGASSGASTAAHKARLTFTLTPEFKAWAEQDQSGWEDQVAFCDFLEKWMHTVSAPPGAALLDMLTTLAGTSTLEFTRGQKTQSGDYEIMFKRQTTVHGGSAQESVEIPAEFQITTPIIEGAPSVTFVVKLKYRIKEPNIIFKIELVRKDDLLKHAFESTVADIASATQIQPFAGSYS